jgi:hypothetical protein
MKKLAVQLGKSGSLLGILAGLIELTFGSHILPWIGNKGNPVGLGFVTLILSALAFKSVSSARKSDIPSNDRKMAIFLGVLLPAAICFTTVGWLWYLPGSLLLATSFLLANDYWFHQSKDRTPKVGTRKFTINKGFGMIGSLLILVSVSLAFIKTRFGLFQSEILIQAQLIRLEIMPMDITRRTIIFGDSTTVVNSENGLVMIVYILLLLGAAIALIASLSQSRKFSGIGSAIVFISLILFVIVLPVILLMAVYPSVGFLNRIGSLGLGWVISFIGASMILVASLLQLQTKVPGQE